MKSSDYYDGMLTMLAWGTILGIGLGFAIGVLIANVW